MAQVERVYTIPLRREYLKAPKHQRAARASRALRSFLVKHMKSDDVKVGRFLNEAVWMHGMKNPPHHVKVNVVKSDDGVVYAELFGKPLKVGKEEKAEEGKKEAKAEKKAEKAAPAKQESLEEKAAPKKEVKKEAAKEEKPEAKK